ncbi:hypothetical protein [Mesorhizobium sp. M0895]|uniref:hypothetical protein n=1 Tax=Mesorhizobium sp. M0895 TaxID=2957019 RepID=UPI003338ED9F
MRLLHDLLVSAGDQFALRYAGLHAVAACRLERGYRLMGIDIGAEDTPIEAGLGLAVGWSKPDDFIGRHIVEAPARQGAALAPASVLSLGGADSAPILIGNEVIWRDDERVGTIMDFGGPGGCSESDKNQFLRDQWDFRVFKSFPMFFDVVVPLRSASVHQADALNASLGREVCARRKEDRVGVQPS